MPVFPCEAVYSSSPHPVSVQLTEDSDYDFVLSGPESEILPNFLLNNV